MRRQFWQQIKLLKGIKKRGATTEHEWSEETTKRVAARDVAKVLNRRFEHWRRAAAVSTNGSRF
jgi:hypothetical protein